MHSEEYYGRIGHEAHRKSDASVPAWEDASYELRAQARGTAHLFLHGATMDPVAGTSIDGTKVMRPKADLDLFELHVAAMRAAPPPPPEPVDPNAPEDFSTVVSTEALHRCLIAHHGFETEEASALARSLHPSKLGVHIANKKTTVQVASMMIREKAAADNEARLAKFMEEKEARKVKRDEDLRDADRQRAEHAERQRAEADRAAAARAAAVAPAHAETVAAAKAAAHTPLVAPPAPEPPANGYSDLAEWVPGTQPAPQAAAVQAPASEPEKIVEWPIGEAVPPEPDPVVTVVRPTIPFSEWPTGETATADATPEVQPPAPVAAAPVLAEWQPPPEPVYATADLTPVVPAAAPAVAPEPAAASDVVEEPITSPPPAPDPTKPE